MTDDPDRYLFADCLLAALAEATGVQMRGIQRDRRRGLWRVELWQDGRRRYIGDVRTLREAYALRRRARREGMDV